MHNSLTKSHALASAANSHSDGYAFRQSDKWLWKLSEMKLINTLLFAGLEREMQNSMDQRTEINKYQISGKLKKKEIKEKQFPVGICSLSDHGVRLMLSAPLSNVLKLFRRKCGTQIPSTIMQFPL